MDARIVDELKAKYPDTELHLLKTAGTEFVVKTPGKGEWMAFQAAMLDEKKRLRAMDALVRSCLVFPDHDTFSAFSDKKPGIVGRLGGELCTLAGMEEEVEKKVL